VFVTGPIVGAYSAFQTPTAGFGKGKEVGRRKEINASLFHLFAVYNIKSYIKRQVV